MDNLLANGGFEADWSDEQNRTCDIYRDGIFQFRMSTQNCFVPPRWQMWAQVEDGVLHLPEMKDAWGEGRHCEGAKGVMYFKTCGRFDAGLYQRVEIPSKGVVTVFLRARTLWPFRNNDAYWDDVTLVLDGYHLSLVAWAHAWSNHPVPGWDKPNDARCSVGVGCTGAFIWEGDAPELCGDPFTDAIGNFTFSVGIDPTGGIDPFASTVVWGRGAHVYNTFAPVSCSIVYRRGEPRVQYNRTYVLLPQSAGAVWAMAVIDASWDSHRFTVGSSADDAGIGNLDYRRIIAVNPSEWGDDPAIDAWFHEHYPGVQYVPVEADNPGMLYALLREF